MLRSLCDKAHRWALALLATHLGIFHNPVCSIPATAAAAATKLNPNPQPLCAAYLQRLQQNKSMHGRNAKGTDAYVFDDELHDLDEVADNVGDSAKLISMASLDLHARPSCAHDDLGGIRVREDRGREGPHLAEAEGGQDERPVTAGAPGLHQPVVSVDACGETYLEAGSVTRPQHPVMYLNQEASLLKVYCEGDTVFCDLRLVESGKILTRIPEHSIT